MGVIERIRFRSTRAAGLEVGDPLRIVFYLKD
jgi:hypothetical protein